MNQDKSYLITGGYGLIGSAITNRTNGRVAILTRSNKHQERITKENVTILTKSLDQVEEKDLAGIDVVYHCASTVDNYNVLTNPYLDVDTNIKGTIALLEACKNLSVKPTIVFPSTFFVYGNEYERIKTPINEESKTDPLAIYPATKLCTESIIKLYSKLYGIPYRICRITNAYGEYEDYNNKKKGGLNYMIMQAIKGEQLSVYKGGDFQRDYIHVDDIVSALLFLEEKDVKNETFLIGYGKAVFFKDLINEVLRLTNGLSRVIEIDPPDFHKIVGIGNFIADTSKINSLGWNPKIDYREGLQKIVTRYTSLLT